MAARGRFEFWIDRGGTFTDCIARDPATGALRVAKLLSSRSRAARRRSASCSASGRAAPIPPCDVRMGTTLATNALLERRGAPFALAITRGFGDLLAIGDQTRPELFDARDPEARAPVPRGARGRRARRRATARSSSGPIRRSSARELARCARSGLDEPRGRRAARLPRRRARARDRRARARRPASRTWRCRTRSRPRWACCARGDTACVDAYLTPLLRDVRGRAAPRAARQHAAHHAVERRAHRAPSASAARTRPVRARGRRRRAARTSPRERGARRAIGFDMGGTSTDVFGRSSATASFEFERVYETEIAGVRIFAPMLAMHTVAAGGGSLCRFDGYRLRVGPESAGAARAALLRRPGSARAHADRREPRARAARRRPLPVPAAARARADARYTELASQLREPPARRARCPRIASGFLEIADANMAEAIRQVSVARGHDVREYALVVFGGAGGQHACALARRLGIRRVLVHPLAGVLSAYGMGVADVAWHGEADAGRAPLAPRARALAATRRFAELEARGRAALAARRLRAASASRACARLDLRYAGTETASRCRSTARRELRDALRRRSTRAPSATRGPSTRSRRRSRASRCCGRHRRVSAARRSRDAQRRSPGRARRARVFCDGAFREDVPVLRARVARRRRTRWRVPRSCSRPRARSCVDPGFELEIDAEGRVVADRPRAASRARAPGAARASTRCCSRSSNNLFMSIAEQMGTVLRRTALSTNIRERLDFSCAVFDRDGGPGRQRAAHPGAPGRDGRVGARRARGAPDARSPATCS